MIALADPDGTVPRRLIGLWPDAGVVLSVDGDGESLRRGLDEVAKSALSRVRHASAA
jgi:hypothetical protein